jgi:hypothetical protein
VNRVSEEKEAPVTELCSALFVITHSGLSVGEKETKIK